MSEVLARIRVKEEHGIRRFLYPLTATITLPHDVFPNQANRLTLIDDNENSIPLQVTLASGRQDEPQRLDFAVSLAPHAQQELRLTLGNGPLIVDDPISFGASPENDGQRSEQRRFALTIDFEGIIRDVIYDNIPHLRGGIIVYRNDLPMLVTNFQDLHGQELLAAWVEMEGSYNDNCQAGTRIELTACKSWATVTHQLHSPKPNDESTFILPFAVMSPTLTCDFGVGGGTFGKLQTEVAKEVVWKTEFKESPYAQWSLVTAGRIDYIGEVATAEEFLPQRWFHSIDSDKALAVAITKVPKSCREMKVSLNVQGDVVINFRLGERVEERATFGVCYHFLNDIPAIAAATNPQSILQPPTVEVLPA